MANNIKTGMNAIVAKNSKTFAAIGLATSNTVTIYEVDGTSLKSWVPGRSINAITGTTAGKGYYLISKADQDLEIDFAPPTGGDLPTAVDLGEFN